MGTNKKKNNTKRGFTLVEVLLATVISALIVVVSYAVFRAESRTQQKLNHYSNVSAYGRYALERISNDIANFYRNPDWNRMLLEGKEGNLTTIATILTTTYPANARADTIRMLVTSWQKVHKDKQEGDVYEVEYKLQYNQQDKCFYLTRRCAPVKNIIEGNAGGVLVRIAKNVSELKFEYYSNGQWQQQWLDKGVLPEKIRVYLTIVSPQGKFKAITISKEIALGPLPINNDQ